MYVDETGNLDYNDQAGASAYFGFGSVTYVGDHGPHLWSGTELRLALGATGINVRQGVHAKNDTWQTRGEVFDHLISTEPRIDCTLLHKTDAYERVRAKGDMYLYQLAWWMHLTRVTDWTPTSEWDTFHVVVASFGTKQRACEARDALHKVCVQTGQPIALHVWDSATSWGLQMADYATWAVQRQLTHGDLTIYAEKIKPLIKFKYLPWCEHRGCPVENLA